MQYGSRVHNADLRSYRARAAAAAQSVRIIPDAGAAYVPLRLSIPSTHRLGYYRTGNYEHYLDREPRITRCARELHAFLTSISLYDRSRRSLDFGCAVGFMVSAMHAAGWPMVGYDVRREAIEYGRAKLGIEGLTAESDVMFREPWHLVLALDVLEHLSVPELHMLSGLTADWCLARIPLTRADGGRFVLRVSEQDPTHVTRLTLASWLRLFEEHGWESHLVLNLTTFYETEGVLCRLFRRRR